MLKKFEGDIFIGRIAECEFERNRHHVQAKHAHPTGAVALFEKAARWQGCATIKDTNIIQTQKATLKNIVAFRVLAVHPPRKVEEQLVKAAFQENAIGHPR